MVNIISLTTKSCEGIYNMMYQQKKNEEKQLKTHRMVKNKNKCQKHQKSRK